MSWHAVMEPTDLVLKVLSFLAGLISFILWSVSFYPQIILNFRRKSTSGLSLQFCIINLTGFACYSVYNIALYFVPAVQVAYLAAHPAVVTAHDIPVHFTDVLFATHATAATAVTLIQMAVYPSGEQRLGPTTYVFFCVSLLIVFAPASLVIYHVLKPYYIIAALGYVKTVSSLVKYVPQAWLNFRRRSTIGWSVGNVMLDISGAGFNLGQTALDAAINGFDVLANVPKLALAAVSVGFDALFIVQHYVLYRARPTLPSVDTTEPKPSVLPDSRRPMALVV